MSTTNVFSRTCSTKPMMTMTAVATNEPNTTYYDNFVRDIKRRIRNVSPLFSIVKNGNDDDDWGEVVILHLGKEIQRIDDVDVFHVKLQFEYDVMDDLPLQDTHNQIEVMCDVRLKFSNRRASRKIERQFQTNVNSFMVFESTTTVKRCQEKDEWFDNLFALTDFQQIYDRIHSILSNLRYSHIHQSFYDRRNDPHYGFHQYLSTPADECTVCYNLTTYKTRCNHYVCISCEEKLMKQGHSPCPCCRSCMRCNHDESQHQLHASLCPPNLDNYDSDDDITDTDD